jgi:hypothetical protein
MGYAEVEMKLRSVVGSDVEDDFRDMLNGRFRPLYSLTVGSHCPAWLLQLIRDEIESGSVLHIAHDEVVTAMM